MAAERIQPGAGAATPPAAATQTLPVIAPAPGLALVEAGKSLVAHDTRGGLCHNCAERVGELVPSLNGAWLYCYECAEQECREECPPVADGPDEDEVRDDFDEEAAREQYMERKAGRAS